MAICKFWQRGNCRNGDSCRFDHPGAEKPIQNSGNRFAALQAPQNQARGQSNERSSTPKLPYSLSKEAIIADLSTERPQWILSAYGPGLRAPAQLFGGPLREQSFEEMRLHYYMGLASGNPAQAIQEADELVRNAELQMQNALQDVDGAIRFIINAENEHPNRIDICNSLSAPTTQASPFGAAPRAPVAASNPFAANKGPQQAPNPFGQPAAPSQGPNPFAQASSGVATGASGAFGRPSALGQHPNPFAAPSSGGSAVTGSGFAALGAAPNPFGAPLTQTANPNPFGAPAQQATANSFGAPSQSLSANPFGAPAPSNISNPFGVQNQAMTANPFGAPTQPAASNPFGAPSQPASVSPFGGPAQTAAANPFAASTPPASNPFGGSSQPSQPSQLNPFGASQQQQASPFANPPVAQSGDNPFARAPVSQSNTFGHQQSAPASTAGTFARPAQESATKNASIGGQASVQDYASRDGNGRLTLFHGKPVMYKNGEAGIRNGDGTWEKVWFPDGPPPHDRNTEVDDSLYDDVIKAAYMHIRETGSFKDGIMPVIPPKREWCSWDF